MKEILILGAGTAGTTMANHLHKVLPSGWQITIVDQEKNHYYQPGWLFVPFDIYKPSQTKKKVIINTPKPHWNEMINYQLKLRDLLYTKHLNKNSWKWLNCSLWIYLINILSFSLYILSNQSAESTLFRARPLFLYSDWKV